MLLDELHCCNLGFELGSADKGGVAPSNMNPGHPASLVGKFKHPDNIVEPARNLV